jgi:hypothetical protein
MKRGTPLHPKVAHLAELLQAKLPTAIGYLELLWHFTAEFAPQGDIGKYSDARIAAGIHWAGRSPTKLVEALVESGFLDRRDDFRLVVHDWHDHADDVVKKRLDRSKLPFLSVADKVTGQNPVVTGKRQKTAENGSLPYPSPSPSPEPIHRSPEDDGLMDRFASQFEEQVCKLEGIRSVPRKLVLELIPAAIARQIEPAEAAALFVKVHRRCTRAANSTEIGDIEAYLIKSFVNELEGVAA